MEKMKRWISVLLTVCMLAVMLPMPAVSEEGDAPAPTQTASAPAADPAPMATQAEEQTSISSSQPTATAAPVPTDEATTTATPAPTDEATGTPAPVPTDEATGTPAPVPTDEVTATSTPVLTDEATATATPVPTDEATATATPVPTDEATATATPVPMDEATGTPAPVPTDEATGTPAPVPTDAATGTPAPVPTDEAEIKTIASFEAVAPEGFAVPQGTLETDLGLPASLNAPFTDGAAGEVAVAWQCAAGYDPSAEAGTQFTFAAVLPEGYALHEGVSLPQILVTLTPPLANAMLMAEGIVERGEGWTLSDDGKLTVTGEVNNSEIPSFESVESIEIVADARLILIRNSNFSGDILIADGGSCNIDGTISDGEITVYGYLYLRAEGEITGSANVQISGDTYFLNFGTISGGTFTGRVENTNTAPSPAAISPARR